VERKLGSNWSIRAEYRYTDFGRVTMTELSQVVGSGMVTQSNQATTRFDQSMQTERVGFAYTFDPSR
jgi:outer membrane immunogenic protein